MNTAACAQVARFHHFVHHKTKMIGANTSFRVPNRSAIAFSSGILATTYIPNELSITKALRRQPRIHSVPGRLDRSASRHGEAGCRAVLGQIAEYLPQ